MKWNLLYFPYFDLSWDFFDHTIWQQCLKTMINSNFRSRVTEVLSCCSGGEHSLYRSRGKQMIPTQFDSVIFDTARALTFPFLLDFLLLLIGSSTKEREDDTRLWVDTDGSHEHFPTPFHHMRPGQHHWVKRLPFLHMIWLSGQRRFVYFEVIALNQYSVSRKQITILDLKELKIIHNSRVGDFIEISNNECFFWGGLFHTKDFKGKVSGNSYWGHQRSLRSTSWSKTWMVCTALFQIIRDHTEFFLFPLCFSQRV